MTTVTSVWIVNKTRGPFWFNEPDVVYIGMPGPTQRSAGIPLEKVGPFGKPWSCEYRPDGGKYSYDEIFERYERYLTARLVTDAPFREAVKALSGKTLVCWCKGKRGEVNKRCHGDILAAQADMLAGG